jgi:hypothetical protein
MLLGAFHQPAHLQLSMLLTLNYGVWLAVSTPEF